MLGRWARGIIGRLRRPIWYVFHFPHASSRLSGWMVCEEFTGRKKGSVDFDLWIYGLPLTEIYESKSLT